MPLLSVLAFQLTVTAGVAGVALRVVGAFRLPTLPPPFPAPMDRKYANTPIPTTSAAAHAPASVNRFLVPTSPRTSRVRRGKPRCGRRSRRERAGPSTVEPGALSGLYSGVSPPRPRPMPAGGSPAIEDSAARIDPKAPSSSARNPAALLRFFSGRLMSVRSPSRRG